MHTKVYLRRMKPHRPGWYYLDLFGWRPFETFNHGGWVFIRIDWMRRHWRTTR